MTGASARAAVAPMAPPWAPATFWMEQSLRHIPLEGRTVLDVGAGDGLFSCYIAQRRAARVVALEPELDGASAGAGSVLMQRVAEYGLSNVICLRETFQEYDGTGGPFDVVLAHNVINHLDESAVVELHRSEPARDRYRALLRRVHELLAPGGIAVIADCGRDNLFARLGIPNPISPTIEWHKHQNPDLWTRLLRDAGLAVTRFHWTYPRRLRFLGPLLDNRVASYLGDSHFVIHAQRSGAPATTR